MKILPGNHQHIGTRFEQQDAFAFGDLSDAAFLAHGGALAVLADGMGGLKKGGEAARLAVRVFVDSYLAKSADESMEDALERSIQEANRAVHSFAEEHGLEGSCGTTLVAAKKLGLKYIGYEVAQEAFNAAQVSVAAAMVNDIRVLLYAVPLLAAGTAAGWAVGWLAQILCLRVGSLDGADHR